jgi:hypothetical protein
MLDRRGERACSRYVEVAMVPQLTMIEPGRRAGLLALGLALMIGLTGGCEDDPTEPADDSLVLPALTSPEAVISAIQVIYNDRTHPAAERLEGYMTLLTNPSDPPEQQFIFHFQPADIAGGLPPSWGLDQELAAHQAIFNAQSAGDVYSLELRVTHDPARELTPPQVGREGWQEVFATNVYLRLMFNVEDGLEVNGGQAEFLFPPAAEGRFRIAEWLDLPRPGLAPRSAVESASWGNIKASFGG